MKNPQNLVKTNGKKLKNSFAQFFSSEKYAKEVLKCDW